MILYIFQIRRIYNIMKQLDYLLHSTTEKEFYKTYIEFKFTGKQYKFLWDNETLYIYLHTATYDEKYVRCKLMREDRTIAQTDKYLEYAYISVMNWLYSLSKDL